MSRSHITKLIEKKRDGKSLEDHEIAHFINSLSKGGSVIGDKVIDSSQVGAMLMAMYIRGLNEDETRALTCLMKESGFVFTWPLEWSHLVVDKHSTGGVGDKVSLVLAPVLAALGLKVPMISGRSLGHTGGTLDKLESIPGFRTELTIDEIQKAVQGVGCCIVSQTEDIVPADRVLYGCRDVTATVSSVPLIIASIASKKLSEGTSALVYDVKFGKGSIFATEDEAEEMAKRLVLASCNDTKCSALFTSMESPLGNNIGNTLEVLESVQCLQGHGPADLIELVEELGSELLLLTQQAPDSEEAKKRISDSLSNGHALQKFYEMLLHQHVLQETAKHLCYGDPGEVLSKSETVTSVIYGGPTGYVSQIEPRVLANIWRDEMNSKTGGCLNAGFVIKRHVGDRINPGDVWLEFHHGSTKVGEDQMKTLQNAIKTDTVKTNTRKRVHKRIGISDGKILVSGV